MSNIVEKTAAILARLRRDSRGNMIALMAAGLVPLTAMIGGGVDMSRIYMVKTRLQQACDAGVLAGRQAMSNGTYTNANKQTASDFFYRNFPSGYQDTTNLSFTSSNPSGTSQVDGDASVRIPTILMKIFGRNNVDVAVDCTASVELANSDITFVLDVTGSMDDPISTGSGYSTEKKIKALRDAMIDFYDAIDSASSGGSARVRYAFVPYNVTVNVGELLYDTDRSWLMGDTSGETYAYQTRRPVWEVEEEIPGDPVTQVWYEYEFFPYEIKSYYCDDYGRNEAFNDGWRSFNPWPSGTPVTWGDYRYDYEYIAWGWGSGSRQWCMRQKKTTYTTGGSTYETVETYDWQPGASFKEYEYLQHSWDVSDYIRSIKPSNGPADVPSEKSNTKARWDGCIEERQTVSADSFTYSSGSGISPSGAYDLDLDLVPYNDATRWAPYWPDVAWERDGSRPSSYTACPKQAQLLTEMNKGQFTSYASGLGTAGNTYHDIGLIWGGRLSSPDGIFKANVTAAPSNGGTVSRNIIFMTDGSLNVNSTTYSAWGQEQYDARVTGGSYSPSQWSRHRSRFLAVCEAIKGKGIRLWVIAFSTSLTSDLTTCASPNSAKPSNNSAELSATFTQIAAEIADLRLTD